MVKFAVNCPREKRRLPHERCQKQQPELKKCHKCKTMDTISFSCEWCKNTFCYKCSKNVKVSCCEDECAKCCKKCLKKSLNIYDFCSENMNTISFSGHYNYNYQNKNYAKPVGYGNVADAKKEWNNVAEKYGKEYGYRAEYELKNLFN